MPGPEYLNYCFIWCARWSQRLMPDPGLRNTVFANVVFQSAVGATPKPVPYAST